MPSRRVLGLPLSLPTIARAHGVPVVAQLHDFFLVCSRFTLASSRSADGIGSASEVSPSSRRRTQASSSKEG
jgi:hypothetical protein